MNRVAIIGTAQTVFSQSKPDLTFADMAYAVTTQALKDAGMTIEDIDNIVTVSNDFWDGRTISSMAVGDAVGAAFGDGKNISTVEGDGAFGAFYGLTRILSGSYETTLVVAHSKASEGDPRMLTNALFDPIYERPLGLDQTTAAALAAQVYLDHYKITPETTAQVVYRNRKNGVGNPHAYWREALTMDVILESKSLAGPIRQADAAPYCDGAAAIILADEKTAKKFCARPAWIEGVSFAADRYFLGDRQLWENPALRQAAAKAYSMAGIANPARDLDVAEIYEEFSYQELLWCEELGFCGPGQAAAWIAGKNTPGPALNPSGGCLCAHAVMVAGLVRLIETAWQIQGRAANQKDHVRRALAHGQSGLAGQSHCVWILGK